MEDSIIVGIAKSFASILLALPVIVLGVWLATKNWAFYSIVVVGSLWLVFIISGPVGEVGTNLEVAPSVRGLAWLLLPVFFTVINLGSIFTVQSIRRDQSETD